MRGEVVMVAMSGGVDSAVAAALVARSGRRAVGVSLRLYDATGEGGTGRCCSPEDFRDARMVAGKLGIPYYILDYEQRFRRDVLRPFVDAYRRGRTPVPCVACNTDVKFGALLAHARQVGADTVATGHYARLRDGAGGSRSLHEAIDGAKDQSYFLFELGQEQLARAEFPVGDLSKEEVRAIARDLGLAVADKPDSQDICFVPRDDYREVVRRETGGLGTVGRIEDPAGRTVGTHGGVAGFTVGQRKGIGVASRERLYVLSVDAERGTVVVGEEGDLMAGGLTASGWRWVSGRAPGASVEGVLKIRYRHPGVRATVEPLRGEGGREGPGRIRATFASPQRAVAPGQAAVLYSGTEVLGGGWIDASLS